MPPIDRRHKRNAQEPCEPDMTITRLITPLRATLLAAALMGGCASVSLQTHTPQSATEAVNLASNESDPQLAQTYLLRSASAFQQASDHQQARRILQSAPLATPLPELRDQYLLLAMASATALDDSGWARQLADSLDSAQFRNYDDNLAPGAARLQAETYQLAGRPLDAAMTLMALVDAGISTDVQTSQDRIWQYLKQTSDQTLAENGQRAVGYTPQGWLELAAIMREPGATLDSQGRRIRDWQYNWAGHPAATTLPSELQLITTLAQERPERIALALPLSGPLASAGEAIRDGFLAAFYEDSSSTDFEIDISVLDTNSAPFAEVYEDIVAFQPDLIVGPLRKEALAELSQTSPLVAPVLALNYLPPEINPPDRFYQFGLAAEDEAWQIAERLQHEQRGQVLALIPAGDWGNRFEDALLAGLDAHGGTALDVVRFMPDENLRSVTADLLGITTSRQRAIDVERTIGLNVEFEPRRRQDSDAIVMVAQPTVARQFKPLFAFYFGGDLPVYAPSLVYEGSPTPSRDRDLNEVRFTDIPWILAEDIPFRDTAGQAFGNVGGQLGRLFAMGVDAYQLSNRLSLLQQVDGAAIDGHTGHLTMAADGSIHRRQLWAQFRNGIPVTLPLIDQEDTGNGAAALPAENDTAPAN